MRVALTLAGDRLPQTVTAALLRRIVRESCLAAFPQVFAALGRRVKLEVALVSDATIQSLNREYRGKDQPTDVLSFGDIQSREDVARLEAQTIDLGTLVLSLPFIRRSATEDGVSWEKEFVFVFSHGVLHLLGFDHEEAMFAIQDAVTDRLAPLAKNKH